MQRLLRGLIIVAMIFPQGEFGWAAGAVADRTLPANYTAGIAVPVSIAVTAETATLVYAVEDAPPTGWVVSAIDNSGVWDGNTGKVKWGPFFDNTARTFTYQATPPAGTSGTKTFLGTASFDGITNLTIGKNSTISSNTGNQSPTVATPAAGTVNSAGTQATLTVLGADDGGESNLSYTWATTGTPPAAVTFSTNTVNAAKSTTATFTKTGAYSFQVTITDSAKSTVTSNVTVTVSPVATTVSLSPASASVTMTKTQQFTATAKDQFGAALSTQPTFSWSAAGGTISTTGLYTAGSTTGGPFTISAAANGKSGTASVTVTNTAPTFATTPTTTVGASGTSATLAVLGADDTGEASLSYSWTVTGTPPAPVTFSANNSNAAKNTTATFSKAGIYNLQIKLTDPGTLNATLPLVVTVTQIATKVTVTPASVGVQANSTQQFSASLTDQFGTAMASQPTFTWSTSGGGSISTNGLFTAGSTAGGPFTITATGGAKSGTASVSVTTTANMAPTVAAAAGSTVNSAGTQATLTVLGADDAGEVGLTYAWGLTGTVPATVAFSVNGTNAAKNTTATFSKVGTYNLRVTITDAAGLTAVSSTTLTINTITTSVLVTPAAVDVHSGATQQFSAVAKDQFGTNLVISPSFTWTVSGGGSISATGLLTASLTPSSVNTVTASANGKSGTATFNVTNFPPTIATTPTATLNAAKSAAVLSVLGADDGGESNITYTWATINTPPAPVTFSVNGTNGAKNTTATFTKVGSYDLRVTLKDASTVSITSDLTVIIPQVVTTIAITPPSASVQTNATQLFSAVATDQFGSVISPTPVMLWTTSGGGTISASGSFTAGATAGGPFTITASNGGESATATVTVTAGSNKAPTITSNATSTINLSGKSSALSVFGADDGGEAALTYTWTTTGTPPAPVTFEFNGTNDAKNTVATFTKVGTYNFLVTIRDAAGASVTSSVTATVSALLTSISLSPASANVQINMTQQFTATGKDQFGAIMGTQPSYIWTVASGGSISSTGLFTAGSTAGGPFTVSATNGGKTGTATVSITAGSNGAPTIATNPTIVMNTGNQSASCSVLGSDNGGESALTYTWATTGTPPAAVSFSVNGTNAAKNTTVTFSKAGVYNFIVTIRDASGLTVTSTVSLPVDAVLASITLSPAIATVQINTTLQFTASSKDQFGNTMAPTPTLTWTNTGGGTISSSGLFTAGNTAGGPFTVTAAKNNIGGTASVTTTSASNTAPTVSAGNDQMLLNELSAILKGIATDDGTPSPLSFSWELASGNSPVTIDNNKALTTMVHFVAAGTYKFRLTVTDGAESRSDEVQVTVTTDSSGPAPIGDTSTNEFNTVDNPFIPSETPEIPINFNVGGEMSSTNKHVRLEIWSRTGLVITLMDADLQPGPQSPKWNGRNEQSDPVGSGTYMAVLKIDGDKLTQKIVVVR